VEAVGEAAFGPPEELGIPPGHPQRVIVRGRDAVVVPVGDEGASEIVITWRDGACPYTIWLARSTSIRQAIDYAARF
jgi:hypothetical protein